MIETESASVYPSSTTIIIKVDEFGRSQETICRLVDWGEIEKP